MAYLVNQALFPIRVSFFAYPDLFCEVLFILAVAVSLSFQIVSTFY